MIAGGCAAKAPNKIAPLPLANVREFPLPAQEVWDQLIRTVRYEFLIPLEFADETKRKFSSRMIREMFVAQKSRYRISGSVVEGDGQTMVTLYKHQEIFVENRWKALVSDLRLEQKILEQLTKQLKD